MDVIASATMTPETGVERGTDEGPGHGRRGSVSELNPGELHLEIPGIVLYGIHLRLGLFRHCGVEPGVDPLERLK
ncbi:hypothetical protein [Streptomyces sp. NPDC050982]|uniref:hypothetical protein n=1 Tax=Streptomyces sp. NPDC050982 TaxID=3154746 RepID=UPI0033FE7EFE